MLPAAEGLVPSPSARRLAGAAAGVAAGALRLSWPFLGPCMSWWQGIQLRVGSLRWCVQSSLCLMRVFFSFGLQRGQKEYENAQLELVMLSWSLCSGGAFASGKSNIKAVRWGLSRAIRMSAD